MNTSRSSGRRKIAKTISILAFAFGCALHVRGQVFTATLSGTNEVPPNLSQTTGTVYCSLGGFVDPMWFEFYMQLPCGRWHAGIYGPANAGTNAALIFDLGQGSCPVTRDGQHGPYSTWMLLPWPITDEQITQLRAGLWYVNVISDVYPNGEVRGQILPVDSDSDGVPDYLDQCPGTPNGDVVDATGCGVHQLCPCDAPWKNHGQYLKAFTEVVARFEHDGLIGREKRNELVKQAAASDCGKR